MTRDKRTIRFRLREPNKNGKHAINLLYRAGKKEVKFVIGFEVEAGWTEENNTDGAIRAEMEKLREKIHQAEIELLRTGREFTAADVMKIVRRPATYKSPDNICQFIEKYARTHRYRVKMKTMDNYTLVRKHLLVWGDDIRFMHMDKDNLISFESWLLSNDYLNSTVNKVMTSLLYMMEVAEQEGLEVHQSYKYFEPIEPKEEKAIVALTRQEVELIMALDLKGRHADVRDMFAFSCATGMRYSDILLLNWNNIKKDRIVYNAVKTGIRVEVGFLPISTTILDRRSACLRPLPDCTSQNCNKYIKEICRMAGINQLIEVIEERGSKRIVKSVPKCDLIQFHTARRTFATIMSAKGVPDNVVMEWTGHKSHANYRKYVGNSSETLMEFMNFWNN